VLDPGDPGRHRSRRTGRGTSDETQPEETHGHLGPGMSAAAQRTTGPLPTASWLMVAGVSGVALLSALFVALVPAGGQTDLTGRTFEEFATQDPEVAALISRQLATVGILAAAFALLALIVAAVPYRAGQRWAWYALWLVPIAFGLVTIRMLIDGYGVGYYYLLLTVVSVVGLLIPAQRFLWSRIAGPRE
jgi:hypothetical protein